MSIPTAHQLHALYQLTQEEFAKKLGVSRATVTRLENAEQNVTLKTLDTITRHLRCDIGELFQPPAN